MRATMPRTRLFAVVLLATPWLVAPQIEPSPAVVPWLVTLACAALLLLLRPYADPSGSGESGWLGGAVLAAAGMLAAATNTVIAACQYFNIEHLFSPMSLAEPGQVYGNLGQRNQYASLTMIGLLAVWWWAGQPKHTEAKPRAWAPIALAAFLAAGNAASSSRTGLVELMLVTGLTLGWVPTHRGKQKTILLVAWGAYSVTSLAVWLSAEYGGTGGILARAGEQVEPCASRLVMWQNMMDLIRQRPWSGWGWGELDYAHFVTVYPGMRECELIDNAHNLPLHLAVELGLPLTMFLLAIALYGLWRGRPWREKDPSRQLAWAVLGVIMAHSMVEYPLWYGPFFLTASVSLALLLQPKAAAQDFLPGRSARSWQVAGSVVLLMGLAFLAWDYFRVSQLYRPPHERAQCYREHTLERVRDSWLFRDQVRFAEYSLTPLTPGNSEQLRAMGLGLLHYSPEPRVVEKLIASELLLGREAEARYYLVRYRLAYPKDYARWAAGQAGLGPDGN